MSEVIERVLKLPLFRSGEVMDVPMTKILCDFRTPFQHVLIGDSPEFGRCLVIDDVMQMSTSDHELYDSTLLRELRKEDRRVLILGGGDGFVAKKIISLNPEAEVQVVDLDIEVIKAVEEYFDQNVFRSGNARLLIGDALHFMKIQRGPFDGIICDLTDSPVGANEQSKYEHFYDEIFQKAAKLLNEGGWISVQSGASEVSEGFIDQVNLMESLLRQYFPEVQREDVLIPSYGEPCAFLFSKK